MWFDLLPTRTSTITFSRLFGGCGPGVDIVRVQDGEAYQKDDLFVLEWAASEGLILLTHDINTTVRGFAYQRVNSGLPMPGVFLVYNDKPISLVAEHIVVIAEGSSPADWEGQVRYLPLS